MKLDILAEADRGLADGLYLALLRLQEHSLLPELYAIFGDKVIEFLDIFAGQTIEVPSLDKLERAVRDVQVYNRLQRTPNRDATLSDLCTEYDLTEQQIRTIEKTMQEWMRARQELYGVARSRRDARDKAP